MIDDGGIGEGVREVRQLVNVRVIEPAFECEPVLAKIGEPTPEINIHQDVILEAMPGTQKQRPRGCCFDGLDCGRFRQRAMRPWPAWRFR
jgi:hypothetical protein